MGKLKKDCVCVSSDRGDLQYKEVKISSEQLLENVGHLLPAGQLIFIATDVKEKEYFNGLKPRFPQVSAQCTYICLHNIIYCPILHQHALKQCHVAAVPFR